MHAECRRVSRVSLVKRAQRLPDRQICSDSDIGDGSGVPIRGWTPPEAVAWHSDWDLCSVWESDQVKFKGSPGLRAGTEGTELAGGSGQVGSCFKAQVRRR